MREKRAVKWTAECRHGRVMWVIFFLILLYVLLYGLFAEMLTNARWCTKAGRLLALKVTPVACAQCTVHMCASPGAASRAHVCVLPIHYTGIETRERRGIESKASVLYRHTRSWVYQPA